MHQCADPSCVLACQSHQKEVQIPSRVACYFNSQVERPVLAGIFHGQMLRTVSGSGWNSDLVVSERIKHYSLARTQAVGKPSREINEALCRACNKHTEHLAHFRVEVEKCVCRDDYFTEVKFNMAFTHHNFSNAA